VTEEKEAEVKPKEESEPIKKEIVAQSELDQFEEAFAKEFI
jgi:hypothetical protein